jgi:DNA-binding PadR family transcriptional regulator
MVNPKVNNNWTSNKEFSNLYNEIYDLSFVEIIILSLLSKHKKAMVRHALFNEVKNYLGISKKLSTSSFYNSLKKLEEMGLISYVNERDSKIKLIKKSKLTKRANKAFLDIIIRLNIVDDPDVYLKLIESFQEKVGKTTFDNILVVWNEDYIDDELFDIISILCNEFFVYMKDDFHPELERLNFKNQRFTTIFNGQFREANDFFDVIFCPFYSKTLEIEGINRIELLKECFRILKKNGICVRSVIRSS